MFINIQKDERGLVFVRGNYQRMLKPGRHFISFFPLLNGYNVLKMKVTEPFKLALNLNLFLGDADLVEELEVLEVRDYEIALHFEDGRFCDVLGAGRYAYWKALVKHKFRMVDLREPEVPEDIEPAIFTRTPNAWIPYLTVMQVGEHEKGLLFVDGAFKRVLEPGKYRFWRPLVSLNMQLADMRRRQLDMTGQELVSADKVTVRMNFVCHYRVKDPVKAMIEIQSFETQLYILLQLILREYVGTKSLDETLQNKESVGDFVLEHLRQKENELGLEFIFAGVKDVILPGEVKEIMNLTLIADKKAQANIITRREETASTRSLLNTARLMEENPTLYRLKELEYLERICERVGNISLTGNDAILERLGGLLGDSREARTKGAKEASAKS